jgi:hypothetical protein
MMCSAVGPVLANVPALPKDIGGYDSRMILGGGAAVVLFVLFVVVWVTRGKKRVKPEVGLAENLAQYPPPPAAGRTRMVVQGHPGRLRLVAVAPVGKKPLSAGQVEGLLEGLVRGLGAVVRQDKPRIRIWPPQLSSAGFAPTFHRLTQRPEARGQPSRWVLLAGPANVDGQPILIGLAFLADKANRLDQMTVEPLEWSELIDVT